MLARSAAWMTVDLNAETALWDSMHTKHTEEADRRPENRFLVVMESGEEG